MTGFSFGESRDGGYSGSIDGAQGDCAYCILEFAGEEWKAGEAATTICGTAVCQRHVRYALENSGALGGYLSGQDGSLVWRGSPKA